MKRIAAVFHLTVPEQRMILVLLLAYVAFVLIQNGRDSSRQGVAPIEAVTDVQPSPSPGIFP